MGSLVIGRREDSRSGWFCGRLGGAIATQLHPGEHGGRTAIVSRVEVSRPSDGLLSVRQAAEQLGLCTATVYGLCADGSRAHIRILNAIRIAPTDLAAFVSAGRVSATPRE